MIVATTATTTPSSCCIMIVRSSRRTTAPHSDGASQFQKGLDKRPGQNTISAERRVCKLVRQEKNLFHSATRTSGVRHGQCQSYCILCFIRILQNGRGFVLDPLRNSYLVTIGSGIVFLPRGSSRMRITPTFE